MNYLAQSLGQSDRIKKVLIITLIGAILTIPLETKINSIFLGSSFLLGLLFCIKERKIWALPNYIYLLPLIFFIRLLWLFRVDDPTIGIKTLDTELPLLMIPFLFSFFPLNKAQKNLLIVSYVCMGLCLTGFTLFRFYNYFLTSEIGFLEFLNLDSARMKSISSAHILNWGLAHYTFYSALLVYGLNALLYFKPDNRALKVLTIFYIIGCISFIYLTGSRLGMVFLFITLFMFLLLKLPLKKRARVHLIAFLFILVLFGFFINFYKQIDGARYMMATIAIKSITERPFLGHGTGSRYELMRNDEFEYHYSYSVNHPHNQFLSEIMQFGIIGTLPLLVFFSLAFYKSYLSSDWQVFTILFLVLALMMFEAPLHSNKAILPLVLILALTSKKATDNDSENES